jgi:hypothetical protein
MEDLQIKFQDHILHWNLFYTLPQGTNLDMPVPKNKQRNTVNKLYYLIV